MSLRPVDFDVPELAQEQQQVLVETGEFLAST
jgi:hypothetical protein